MTEWNPMPAPRDRGVLLALPETPVRPAMVVEGWWCILHPGATDAYCWWRTIGGNLLSETPIAWAEMPAYGGPEGIA